MKRDNYMCEDCEDDSCTHCPWDKLNEEEGIPYRYVTQDDIKRMGK